MGNGMKLCPTCQQSLEPKPTSTRNTIDDGDALPLPPSAEKQEPDEREKENKRRLQLDDGEDLLPPAPSTFDR